MTQEERDRQLNYLCQSMMPMHEVELQNPETLIDVYDLVQPPWEPMVEVGIKDDGRRVFENNRYVAFLRRTPAETPELPALLHLSFHDHRRTTRHDWRDLQRLKNDILGPEQEMLEFYPPESLLVDTANEYHLWGFEGQSLIRSGVGINDRRLVVEKSGLDDPRIKGSKQRPWRESERPPDLQAITKEMLDDYDKKVQVEKEIR